MAEGDGAWVVLGRKIDRFQSPSGDPERPQGVPEAGRGVILSVVCVFFEKWSANFWLSPQMQPFQTNSWQDSRCRLPPLRPSAHPTWLQTKASNMFHLQGRASAGQVQHRLPEEENSNTLRMLAHAASTAGKPTTFLTSNVTPQRRAERDADVCKDCKYPSCLGCKRTDAKESTRALA